MGRCPGAAGTTNATIRRGERKQQRIPLSIETLSRTLVGCHEDAAPNSASWRIGDYGELEALIRSHGIWTRRRCAGWIADIHLGIHRKAICPGDGSRSDQHDYNQGQAGKIHKTPLALVLYCMLHC